MTKTSPATRKGRRGQDPDKRSDALRCARLLVAIVAGYVAVSWTGAWVALVLVQALGMQRGDAVILMTLLSIVGYAAIVAWAFGHPSTVRTLCLLLVWCLLSVTLTQILTNLGPGQLSGGGG